MKTYLKARPVPHTMLCSLIMLSVLVQFMVFSASAAGTTAAANQVLSFMKGLAAHDNVEIPAPGTPSSVDTAFIQVGTNAQSAFGVDYTKLHATAAESLSGVGERPMLRMDADAAYSVNSNAWSTGGVTVEFNLKTAASSGGWDPYDLTDVTALMFYVKLADTGSATGLWFNEGTDVNWMEAKASLGKPYYTLAKGAKSWSTSSFTESSTQYMAFTGGFEGWVRIPVSSLGGSGAAKLYDLRFGFQDFGGSYGPVYIGNLLVATNEVVSGNKAIIDDDSVIRDLFTGEEAEEEEVGPNPVDLTGISTAKQFEVLRGIPAGTPIATNNQRAYLQIGSALDVNKIAVSTVPSLSGVYDYSMLKLDTTPGSPAYINCDRWSSEKRFGVELVTFHDGYYGDIRNSDALMFYIKTPATPHKTGIWLELRNVEMNGGTAVGESAPQPQIGATYLTLEKGTSKWKSQQVSSPSYMEFAGGFEGWVRIQFTSMNAVSPYYDIYSLIAYFNDFGGEYGPVYFGAPLIASNTEVSNNAVVIDGRKKIQNLFTGAEMTREEVFPRLNIGEEIIAMPNATTDFKLSVPEDTDITATSVKLNWEAFPGAAGYEVELFENFNREGVLSYVLLQRKNTADKAATMTGLESGLRYSAIVYAVNADGVRIATYNSISFFSGEESGWESPETVTPDIENPKSGESSPGILEYSLAGLAFAAVMALALKKRRRAD